jgi:hypothetical protein
MLKARRISQRHIRLILEEAFVPGGGSAVAACPRFPWLPYQLLVYRMRYPPPQSYAGGVKIADTLCRPGSLESL